MRSYATSLVAGAAVTVLAGTTLAGGGVCWDNDIVPNGTNGRATDPPTFPDIRVVSDFSIGTGVEWTIFDLHKSHIEDSGFNPGSIHEVYLYEDGGGCPGAQIASIQTDAVNREFQGYQLFTRDVYIYWIEFDAVTLGPGKYHIGSRWPNASGNGTSYWLTSNGGEGTDATDCFSLDAGASWADQGPDWHMSYELTGSPCEEGCETCPGDLDEDCDVDFQDLLTLLANWGPCGGGGNPYACDDPGTCDNGFPPCNGGDCLCFVRADGNGGVCISGSTSCAQPACPGGQRDCEDGWVCTVETCCGEPICAPPESLCETGAAPAPMTLPGTPTFAGIR